MAGISTRQGPHHVAQKFSNTTFPLSCERLTAFPARSRNMKFGASSPTWTTPRPTTDCLTDCGGWASTTDDATSPPTASSTGRIEIFRIYCIFKNQNAILRGSPWKSWSNAVLTTTPASANMLSPQSLDHVTSPQNPESSKRGLTLSPDQPHEMMDKAHPSPLESVLLIRGLSLATIFSHSRFLRQTNAGFL